MCNGAPSAREHERRAGGYAEGLSTPLPPTAAEALWLSWTPFDDESLASELGGLLDL